MKLAVIPARSGSKRIKNKNITKVYGKPIIYYVINKLLKSKIFDKVIVSTDSDRIIDLSNKYGAETPFKRPKSLSGDKTRASSVIKHSINYFKRKKINFEYVCCVYPTSIFLNTSYIAKAIKLLEKNKKKSFVITITQYKHPLERAFEYKKNIIKPIFPDKIKERTQDLKTFYHDAAQFYLGRSSAFEKNFEPLSDLSIPITIDSSNVLDIDNYDDLELLKKIKQNYII